MIDVYCMELRQIVWQIAMGPKTRLGRFEEATPSGWLPILAFEPWFELEGDGEICNSHKRVSAIQGK